MSAPKTKDTFLLPTAARLFAEKDQELHSALLCGSAIL